MREGAHTVLAAAARFYTPLIVLFALLLLAMRPAGAGVGFLAGLAFLLALTTHALVFGADASRAAAPPFLMRVLAAIGLAAAAIGATAPGLMFAREIVEAGLFVLTGAGGALIIAALFGRAPTMRDEAP
jgi:multisubunit Na+/H+ antiporter MnhB subunit